jgi:hypothetical protein
MAVVMALKGRMLPIPKRIMKIYTRLQLSATSLYYFSLGRGAKTGASIEKEPGECLNEEPLSSKNWEGF